MSYSLFDNLICGSSLFFFSEAMADAYVQGLR